MDAEGADIPAENSAFSVSLRCKSHADTFTAEDAESADIFAESSAFSASPRCKSAADRFTAEDAESADMFAENSAFSASLRWKSHKSVKSATSADSSPHRRARIRTATPTAIASAARAIAHCGRVSLSPVAGRVAGTPTGGLGVMAGGAGAAMGEGVARTPDGVG